MGGPIRLSRRSAVAAAGVAGLGLLTPQIKAADARDVPWLAEIQSAPAALPNDAPTLNDLLLDERGQRITTIAEWTKRRESLKKWWLEFLGPLPAERKLPPTLAVVEEDSTDGVIRQLVRYEVEPGILSEAYLLRPERPTAKARGIVAFHSTVNYTIRQPAGLEGPAEKHFGLRFAKKGCVCLCPRNY